MGGHSWFLGKKYNFHYIFIKNDNFIIGTVKYQINKLKYTKKLIVYKNLIKTEKIII